MDRKKKALCCQTQPAGATAEKISTLSASSLKKYISNLTPYRMVDFSPKERLRSGCLAAAVRSDKRSGWHCLQGEQRCFTGRTTKLGYEAQRRCCKEGLWLCRDSVGALEVSLGWECPRITDTSVGASVPPCCAPASHPPLGTCSPSCPCRPKTFSLHPSFSPPCSSFMWSGTLQGWGQWLCLSAGELPWEAGASTKPWAHRCRGAQIKHMCVHVCVCS